MNKTGVSSQNEMRLPSFAITFLLEAVGYGAPTIGFGHSRRRSGRSNSEMTVATLS